MAGYSAVLKSNKEIYVPKWPVNVALQNLTYASKYLGVDNIINIADINTPAVIVALSGADDPASCTKLIMDFVCEARIDGSKITASNVDDLFEDSLHEVAEIFAHVIHAQYSDFFELGLAKENSPEA